MTGKRIKPGRAGILLIFLCCMYPGQISGQRLMENLDRGLVAVKVSNGVRLSWRILDNEYLNATYNVYRGSTRINDEPIAGASNYLDPDGTISETYSVASVINDIEQTPSEAVTVWSNNYHDIPIDRPPGGTTPDGVDYTYNANDLSVGDLDGDGQYEIVLKWDPSNSKDNSQSGYTGNVYLDAYEMNGARLWRIDLGINIRAGAHYTQFMVYDLDGDGTAEVACKTADGTTDATGTVIGNSSADYRNTSGYILSGPEFLTIFDGKTGAILQTVDYLPPRGSVSSWGDSYGNRVDRFLACIAYLDGQRPSLVMCRGYYTRTVLAAWDWRDDTLTSRWIFDSKNGYPEYEGQGNHNLSVADVDEDGKDEIIYGACAIDDDGTGLWSTGLGHGDAMHVSDIDPSRPGLEKWGITESPSTSGSQLLDARTGEVIWETAPADVGRGVSADLTSSWPGMECWGNTGGLRSATGEPAGTYPSSSNFVIWWDSDDLRELLDNVSITKYGAGTLLTATNCASNNGTKATPCLSADLLGDWREEVIFRTVDNNALRLYITTYPCTRRLYTLMRDPQYRLSIAWQNVAYNQPPHTGFFLGYGMADPPPPPTIKAKLRWFAGNTWDNQVSKNWIHNDSLSVFQNGDDVLFDLSGSYSEPISVAGNITPSAVSIYAPYDLVFTGPGSLSGPMNLLKAGAGKLTLNADNDFSGTTYVWKGELLLNGSLANSPVEVYNGASAGGKGIFGNGLTLKNGAALYIGAASYADTLTIKRQMLTEGTSSLFFDLSSDTSSLLESNDLLMVDGDLAIGNKLSFNITLLDDSLQKGYYTLIRYTGTLNGTAECFTTAGLAGIPHKIVINDNSILLRILKLRNPSRIFWSGSQTPDWDVATSLNWLRNEEADWFVPNDTVIFDDSGDPGTGINLVGLLHIGMMTVDASLDYAIEGSGQITGPGGLIKNGTGTLKLLSQNDYHGPTTINKGIIEVSGLKNAGQPSPVGSSSADPSNFVFNGGTLRLLGSSSVTDHGMTLLDEGGTLNLLNSNTDLTVSGMITGTGMLRKTGKGTLILTRANTYSGGTLIRDGSIDLGSEEANQGAFGSGNVRLENTTLHMLVDRNTYTENCSWNLEVPSGYKADLSLDSRCTLTGSLTGAGTLNLIIPYVRSELDGDWSAFTGRINAITSSDEGWFLVGNNNSFGSASINLGDHVLMLYRESADAAVEIGELTGTEDSELGAGGEGTNSITWMIGGKNSTAEFHGLISDRQFKNTGSVTNIIKTGTGNWTLTHANTYSGTTEITGGILTVDCDGGSATGSGDVTVRAGAALRGRGSLAGKLIVESQASLTIGVGEQVEELIINLDASFEEGSYLSMHMDPLAKTCDKLTVEGKLKIGGILFINILTTGTFLPAETYRIFEAQEITGSFEMIIPKSPGEGLVWDTTWLKPYGLLRIAQEGTISVEHTHEKASLIVSPNPGKDMVEVSVCYPSQGMETVSVLKCYDHSGRLIRQVEMVRNGGYARCELETGNWSSGIYLFVVSTDKESLIERFIKQ